MPLNKKVGTIILFSCFFLLYPQASEGRKAKFTDFLVTNNADKILVYARVEDCFTKKMESAILAGVPTTFRFFFEFYRERPYWPDERLARRIVTHTIKYDNVKKTFQVFSTDNEETATFQTLDNAKRAMAELNGIALFPVAALTKGVPYYVMIKGELDKVRLPLHMEYLFFFVSLWDFETGWYMQRLKY